MKISAINIVCFFFLLGCQDVYKFKAFDPGSNLIVNGGIHDGPGPFYVDLGTTNVPDQPAYPLTGASLSITTDQGLKEQYHEVGNGRYALDGTIVTGTPGVGYTLEINLPGGNTYHSTLEVMPNVIQPIDSPYWKIVHEKVVSSEGVAVDYIFMNVYLNSTLQQADSTGYFRWGIDEVYMIFPHCPPSPAPCPPICYVSKPVSTYNVLLVKTSDYGSGSSLANVLMQSQGIDFTFSAEHIFNVSQYSMNRSTYEYWIKVQELIMKRGSIFETPPAKIVGNISNNEDPNEVVFGYFEATARKISRLKVARGNIPFYLPDCEDYPDYQVNRYCASCEYLPGSSMVEPAWWF